MKTIHRLSVGLFVTMLGASFGQRVFAQDTPSLTAVGSFGLEEIFVTARRFEEPLQDVPIGVTAFSSADIEARRLGDLADIALSVPNVVFSRERGQGLIAIRGFADEDPIVTSDPLVGLYIDGVYFARQQGGLFDMIDPERVEVLKGPQGTLFGKNTLGGAVSITSRIPQGDDSGFFRVTAGENERLNVEGSYDFGVTDALSLRVSGALKNRDCLARRVNDDGCLFDEDAKILRAYANYQPGDDLRVALILDGTWDDSGSQLLGASFLEPGVSFVEPLYELDRAVDPTLPPFDPVGIGEPFVQEGNLPTDDYLRNNGASLRLERGLYDNVTLLAITAYRDHESKQNNELDFFRATFFESEWFTFSKQFSQELILQGIAARDRLDWQVGVFYFDEDARTESFLGAPSAFGNGFNQFITSQAESLAGFSHVSYDLTDRLRLSGGLRYTTESRDFSARGDFANAPGGNGFVAPVSADDRWSATTPKVTLDFKPTNDQMLYATISEGFRSGGFNGNTSISDPTQVGYDPEFVTNYELGFKATFLDRRVQFNTAAYFMDYTDKQFSFARLNPDGTVVTVKDNAANAEVTGIELDLSVAVTEKLRFEAGYAHNDSKYTEIGEEVVTSVISIDSPFLYAPEDTANLSLQYTEPQFGGVGEVSFRVDMAYRDRIYFYPDVTVLANPVYGPSNFQERFTKVNARITYAPQDVSWSLALYGRNLTDKIIWERNLGLPAVGYDLPTWGEPRELGVELRVDF